MRAPLIIRIALALLVALAASPASAQDAPGAASVFPQAGPAGTRFSFIASGYRPRERVAVWLNTPDGRALPVEVESLRPATREGRANWIWQSPGDAQEGTYQMVAHGVSSGVEHVLTFRIGAVSAPEASERANVHPGVGRPGGLFLFFATGYHGGEGLAFWVNRPDGAAVAVVPERLAQHRGRVDFSWLAPQDAPRGRWEMVVAGRESGVQNVIPFVIQ
ncbi:MAG TPA: hypothetical protein VNL77_00415 [Roseiflexaceae bacterium]|nr:hypothetical protein [Roseiflexaceae bacterium]